MLSVSKRALSLLLTFTVATATLLLPSNLVPAYADSGLTALPQVQNVHLTDSGRLSWDPITVPEDMDVPISYNVNLIDSGIPQSGGGGVDASTTSVDVAGSLCYYGAGTYSYRVLAMPDPFEVSEKYKSGPWSDYSESVEVKPLNVVLSAPAWNGTKAVFTRPADETGVGSYRICLYRGDSLVNHYEMYPSGSGSEISVDLKRLFDIKEGDTFTVQAEGNQHQLYEDSTESAHSAALVLPTMTITASAGTGGSISPSGRISVAYGGEKVFTVTPDSGYRILRVLIDGSYATSVSDGKYALSNVISDHTISAEFFRASPQGAISAIDSLNDASSWTDLADTISKLRGLSSAEQAGLPTASIQKLENVIKAVPFFNSLYTGTISPPSTTGFQSGDALPAAPAATGLTLVAAIMSGGFDPIAVTLSTTQQPAAAGTLLTVDFTLTKRDFRYPEETVHTTLPFPVKISIPLPASFVKQANYTYKVVHTKADGTTENLPATISDTAGSYTATFTTTSFSTFSLVGTSTGGSHHSSDGSGSGSSSSPGASAAGTSATATFVSDTNQDFSINGAYQFKITSQNDAAPSLTVGTPGMFETRLVSTSGNNYFFKLTAIGKPGDKAGIYVNGVKLLVATVGATASVVKSDTTGQFKISQGKTYLFRLTADSRPSLVPGNSSAFQVKFIKQSKKDYFYLVTAVGKSGQATGFYMNTDKSPIAIATIT